MNKKKYDREYSKKYRKEHAKKVKEYNKKWEKENPKWRKEYSKKWAKENPAKIKEYTKRAKPIRKKILKKWQKENPEKIKIYNNRWRKKNLAKVNIYLLNRRKTDIQYRLNSIISTAIRASLRGKKAGRKWELLAGYTLKDLIQHLEKLFDSKMNWDNYGNYWHIDHIKPKSLFHFNLAEDKEFKECWALENLQPLEKIANLKKGNHYKKRSQK